jgi:integrase
MRKPWFRKGRGYFVTTDSGKQVRLGSTEQEAYAEWERIRDSAIEGPDPYVAAVVEAFLESMEANRSAATFSWYSGYLLRFVKAHGAKRCHDLRRHHLTRWVESEFATPGARAAGIRTVKTCLNWAAGEEIIRSNPFARVRTPGGNRRETLVYPEAQRRILEDLSHGKHRRPFRLYLIAMRHSGCRPGEIRRVTAEHFDQGLEAWVFAKHKTSDKVQRKRVVHLSPCLLTLTRILARARPKGSLFRNADGEPWSKNAIVDRMRRIRVKFGLPPGATAYSFRHGFITDGLMRGVDVATMAALTGTSVEMISRHYGHLEKHGEHLKRAHRQAIGIPAVPGS